MEVKIKITIFIKYIFHHLLGIIIIRQEYSVFICYRQTKQQRTKSHGFATRLVKIVCIEYNDVYEMFKLNVKVLLIVIYITRDTTSISR